MTRSRAGSFGLTTAGVNCLLMPRLLVVLRVDWANVVGGRALGGADTARGMVLVIVPTLVG